MNSIPTVYAGAQFGSTLEAKWAAFFDLMGWRWHYEPQDLSGYIPDFVLQFEQPMLVEVKPEYSFNGLRRHFNKIRDSGWRGWAAVVGVGFLGEPYCGSYGACFGAISGEDILSEDGTIEMGDPAWGDVDTLRLIECAGCRRLALNCCLGSYQCLLCGYYDGDRGFMVVPVDRADAYWREAANHAQWGGVQAGKPIRRAAPVELGRHWKT